MNFTYNNHLSYSIGGRPYDRRLFETEKFIVDVGPVDKDIFRTSNFRNELNRTADCVHREFGKDLVVFLSGGTDSEIVLRNFLDIGVRPKCVTIRFKGDYNSPDVLEAIEIAKELDVDLEIIDFDVLDFYRSGIAAEFGKEVSCTQITYLMVYYNIMKLGCPAVMGGEALLSRHVTASNSSWYYTFRENEDASAMRFSLKYSLPLVNEWFSYTPELLLFYLDHPDIVNLVSTKYNYKLSSVSSKNDILKKLFPEIRPKIKTHGFERLLGFNFEAYRHLTAMQVRRLESSLDGIEYNTIVSKLRGI